MKTIFITLLTLVTTNLLAAPLPSHYTDLLKYVQPAPDQGETSSCWFVASTGAMELLLNKKDNIKNPKIGGKNDLSESFLIWQKDYWDEQTRTEHFIEEVVIRFNHGEAIHNSAWPYNAYYEDGSDSQEIWNKHPDFDNLPRVKVPKLKTKLLFARGKKYATEVLLPEDIVAVKEALVKYQSPVIINYNDDGYWHVVLIVGYDDRRKGECYEIEKEDCARKGAFFVRDSNGKTYEKRDYNWFLYMANAAAVVELK